jgi:hypothetical protein
VTTDDKVLSDLGNKQDDVMDSFGNNENEEVSLCHRCRRMGFGLQTENKQLTVAEPDEVGGITRKAADG